LFAAGVDAILPSDKHGYDQDVLDNIPKIFNLAVPGFEAAMDHTISRSTRPPGVYDKHLDKPLRPSKVAYCPGLNLQIEEIADKYYQKYIEKFGPPPECDSTNPERIQRALHRHGAHKVKCEDGIIPHYARVMRDIVLPIVSPLAFEAPSWWTQYLQWTRELRKDKAIADGALRVDLDFPPRGSIHHDCPYAPVGFLSGETSVRDDAPMSNCPTCDHPSRKELKDVAHYFPCVTPCEFKNLLAGSYEHLIALLEITCGDDVPWEECDSQTCEHDAIDFRVTGSKTGFDAANPIIQLEATDWTETEIGHSLHTSKPRVRLKNGHRVSARRIFQQVKISCQFLT
jgi:hypothetical protein